jgi:putative restriction endonuclease
VDDYWQDRGRAGFLVWRYRLVKLENQEYPQHSQLDRLHEDHASAEVPDTTSDAPPRRESTVLRIVRDTRQSRRIKELYDYRCQMCGTRLEGLAGPYAEAAHIKPLGAPHNGPDTSDNILCLCPNHHVLLDHGGVAIGEDFALIGAKGELTVHARHQINEEHSRYRREHYRTEV